MALTDEAIAKIKQRILDGRLRPGDRLSREADLAEDLGISRSSLREAVRALTLARILDVRRGDGTYVTSLGPDLLLDTMSFFVDFHQRDGLLHLFEVRRALEPAAAERASVVMSDADAHKLIVLLDELGPNPDIEALVANDIEFHRRTALGSGNPVLCSLIDSLSSRTARVRVWRGVNENDAVARTVQEHHAIANAIIDRQPSLARSWATVHIAGVEEWIRHSLSEDTAAKAL